MAVSSIRAVVQGEVHRVWEAVLGVGNYEVWRTDIMKTEIIDEKRFVEYTKDGYSTTFTVTVEEPFKRWEFDLENSNIKGHWTGSFASRDGETEIVFTECVTAKKFILRPFLKAYLKRQQDQFVTDLKKYLCVKA